MRTHCLWTLCMVVGAAFCSPEPQPVTQLPGYTQLTVEQVKHLQNRGFGSTVKTYRSTVAYREYDENGYGGVDSEPESSQNRAPTFVNQNYPVPTQPIQNYPLPARTTLPKAYPLPTPRSGGRPPIQQYSRRGEEIQGASNKLEEEEEKEEEEPDRLSLLLPQSKFSCVSKHTGYYADEDLSCEVFHYCQDNAKHSWICPEGFTFHQVHLICMPPGGDNICEKSSSFHFVNDFLYKPLNLEEYQHKPNVTLRYSDRYYPDEYRSKYNEEDEEEAAPNNYKHSVRVTGPSRQQSTASPIRPATIRPQVSVGQVFRSPEEINISLQQRRPVQYTTAKYSDY